VSTSAVDVRQGDRMKTYRSEELPRLRATATCKTPRDDARATSAPSHAVAAKTPQVS